MEFILDLAEHTSTVLVHLGIFPGHMKSQEEVKANASLKGTLWLQARSILDYTHLMIAEKILSLASCSFFYSNEPLRHSV